MTRPALVANLLTLLAFPVPSAAAPAVPAAVPQPGEVEPTPPATAVAVNSALPEIGLGTLQLLSGYLIGVGGTILLAQADIYPEELSRSDTAAFTFLGVLAPALTTAAVCGTGYLSSRYRSRCSTTLLGAYAGVALGLLLGAVLGPGDDPMSDLPENTISMVIGAALVMPVGAVAAWHISKAEIAPPAPLTAQQSRNLMMPVVSLRW